MLRILREREQAGALNCGDHHVADLFRPFPTAESLYVDPLNAAKLIQLWFHAGVVRLRLLRTDDRFERGIRARHLR